MNDNSKILETLHTQFAVNQNHHQGIFIQLLIALLSLFGGFGYIYIHTNSEIIYSQTFAQKLNGIDSYSLSTLISTSVIVIAILTLLNAILLNLGYGFRRDQYLNKIIREKYLINGEYEKVFGKLYNPANKGYLDFLPNFYSIFFWFILGFQIFFFITTCSKEQILNFDNHYWIFILLILDVLLILGSVCLYCNTYHKYKLNIKNNYINP